jgi:hypothetical protein
MPTIGHVFVPVDREHDGTVPTDNDQAHFESLPVPLELWEPFQQCLSKHLSELTEGQIDRKEKFWFEATHVNAMTAVVEAEAVTDFPSGCRCRSVPSFLNFTTERRGLQPRAFSLIEGRLIRR